MEKIEEYYEKLRAILNVVDVGVIEENDRVTLIWVAKEYLELIGEVIGINGKKSP